MKKGRKGDGMPHKQKPRHHLRHTLDATAGVVHQNRYVIRHSREEKSALMCVAANCDDSVPLGRLRAGPRAFGQFSQHLTRCED